MRAARLIVPCLLMLGACGDPLADIERVTDDTFNPDIAAATALPTQAELDREESVLSGLFRKAPEPDAVADAVTTPDDTGGSDGASADVAVAQPQSAEPASGRKGLLSWLRSTTIEDQATAVALLDESAAVPNQTPGANAADPAKDRRVIRQNTSAGLALREAGLGANLPFGEVARVCDVAKRDLGKLVERSEPRRSGYVLYDSAPTSSKPRSFYVTGFSDSCARQFTASLAVFGTPAFHEQLRYGLPAEEYPYSTTDRAYEKVKAKPCNVGPNKPCGARISRVAGSTAFISVYEHFGENARWADMLLHDGALLATAVKTP